MCSQKIVITKDTIIDGLSNNFFTNNYQPIYNVEDNSLNGVEVLLRYKSPCLGDVSPDIFIASAERDNLISELFFFSANQAIKDLTYNNRLKKISINISPSTLNVPYLYQWLDNKCKENCIPNKNITLEITENVEYIETKTSLENIEKLNFLGFGLSIDDFGTGYSSLSRLRAIPFTELKIDKMFIENITTNYSDRKIIEHLVDLTQSMGLQTVAEGIENLETYRIVKELGVNLCQGYFFHKPMAIDDILNVSI
ncbi:EAL domain-containing protein [Photobacterium piscicola]|uniref:Phytochrome-like protein cph2 n=1 Tax=Photobacterium piscicola TaxID=1378299 RepID=A0A1T5HUT2_9GAMM|nr:EAL domain-containing protein [Photobacterium piscicola]SKC30576.1 Phytochrome-like protein cph2 [Photobacterium piscicola]